LIGSAVVRVVVFFAVGPHAPSFVTYIIWSYFFLPSTFMFFMLGHLARRVPRIGAAGLWPSLALMIAAVWLVSRNTSIPAGDWLFVNDYAGAALFAVALPGIFEATKNNRLSNWLGDLTYPLYLTHHLTMAGLFGQWGIGAPGVAFVNYAKSLGSPYAASFALFELVMIVCLPVALLVHVLVELPLRSVAVRLIKALETLFWQPQVAPVPATGAPGAGTGGSGVG
jgi:peptidoglycan/LPS O-acetylase OafA/YrhL